MLHRLMGLHWLTVLAPACLWVRVMTLWFCSLRSLPWLKKSHTTFWMSFFNSILISFGWILPKWALFHFFMVFFVLFLVLSFLRDNKLGCLSRWKDSPRNRDPPCQNGSRRIWRGQSKSKACHHISLFGPKWSWNPPSLWQPKPQLFEPMKLRSCQRGYLFLL